MRSLFADLSSQGHSAAYLQHAFESGNITHAYLIAGGAPGAGFETALRFASGLIAGDDDDAYECALRQMHPDLHVYAPGGRGGYLVEQIRDITHDTELAPIRALVKVYIIQDAHRLAGAPANAFLKTLEEPPGNVICILLANNEAAVLETLKSRCEVLVLNAPSYVTEGNVQIFEMLSSLAHGCSTRQLLADAKRFVAIATETAEAACDPDEDIDAYIEKYDNYLSSGAKKQIEERGKRESTARERAVFLELLGSVRTWLRDCLATREGATGYVLYTEQARQTSLIAQNATVSDLLCAIDAVATACSRISYNVSPQLAIEAMFLEIREALCRK